MYLTEEGRKAYEKANPPKSNNVYHLKDIRKNKEEQSKKKVIDKLIDYSKSLDW